MAGRFQFPYPSVFDANGNPLSGAKLNFYQSGTSTPLNTFSDAALSIPNANPVVADSAGRFSDIFLGDGPYKVVLSTSAAVVQWTADPVFAPSAAAGASVISLPAVGGTGNAVTLTYAQPPIALVAGLRISFRPTAPNTGATTVQVNGLTAKNVMFQVAGSLAALSGGEFQTGQVVDLEYDGTQFQLLNLTYSAGSWTPADASGAALVLTVSDAQYVKVGKMLTLMFSITYPATGSGVTAKISGLPAVPKALAGLDQIFAIVLNNSLGAVARLDNGGTATMTFATTAATATPSANSVFSGLTITGTFTYITA